MNGAFGELWRRWESWLAFRAPQGADVESVSHLLVALAIVLAGALLGLGAQTVPVLAIVAVGAIATAVVALRDSTAKVEGPALLLFALGAWSLLQAMPLPLGVVRKLNPKAADIWAHAYELTGTGRTWASISLDPRASVVEALKWTTYGAIAVTACLVTRRLGTRFITWLTLGLALLLAVVTLGHGVARAHSVFGVYVPTWDPGPWGMSPIMNENNRAGYLNLGAFAGLSLLISERLRSRWWWPVALVSGLLVAMSLLTNSRGGVVALAVTSLGLLGFLFRRALQRDRQQHQLHLRTVVPPMLVLAGGVSLAVMGADSDLWTRMRHESMEKLHVTGRTLPMLADFPIFGVGRGAFETVFPAYGRGGDHIVFHHAENFATDWATEWGLPVSILALFAFAWMVRPRKGEESSRVGLRFALCVLLIQNLVDHALEMPAVGMLVAAIVAALGMRRTERVASESVRRIRAPLLGIAGAALTAGLLVFGWDTALHDRETLSERTRTASHADDPMRERRETLAAIRAAVVRHPADPFLPLLGAMTARHVREGNAVRWLGWALERDMMSGHTHLVVAYFLRAVGATSQALMELRIAAERSPWLRSTVAAWAATFTTNPAEALTVVLEGADGAPMLVVLAGTPLFAAQRLDLLEEVTTRDPLLLAAHKAAATAHIQAIQNHEGATCQFAQRSLCVERVNNHILALARLEPSSSTATELTAQLLAATNRQVEARNLLSTRCSSFSDSMTCWQLRVSLANGELSGPPLREALQSYYAAACRSPGECVRAATWLASELAGRRDYLGALEYYGRAVQAGEETPALWLAISHAARAAGQPRRANEALERARRAAQADPELRGKIEEEEHTTAATAPIPE